MPLAQKPRRKRRLGQLAGVLRAAPDFDAPSDLELFEAGHAGDPLRGSRA